MTQEAINTAMEKLNELIEEARTHLGAPSKAEIRDLQNRADDLYDRIG